MSIPIALGYAAESLLILLSSGVALTAANRERAAQLVNEAREALRNAPEKLAWLEAHLAQRYSDSFVGTDPLAGLRAKDGYLPLPEDTLPLSTGGRTPTPAWARTPRRWDLPAADAKDVSSWTPGREPLPPPSASTESPQGSHGGPVVMWNEAEGLESNSPRALEGLAVTVTGHSSEATGEVAQDAAIDLRFLPLDEATKEQGFKTGLELSIDGEVCYLPLRRSGDGTLDGQGAFYVPRSPGDAPDDYGKVIPVQVAIHENGSVVVERDPLASDAAEGDRTVFRGNSPQLQSRSAFLAQAFAPGSAHALKAQDSSGGKPVKVGLEVLPPGTLVEGPQAPLTPPSLELSLTVEGERLLVPLRTLDDASLSGTVQLDPRIDRQGRVTLRPETGELDLTLEPRKGEGGGPRLLKLQVPLGPVGETAPKKNSSHHIYTIEVDPTQGFDYQNVEASSEKMVERAFRKMSSPDYIGPEAPARDDALSMARDTTKHAKRVVQVAEEVCRQLRLTDEQAKHVMTSIRGHDFKGTASVDEARAAMVALFEGEGEKPSSDWPLILLDRLEAEGKSQVDIGKAAPHILAGMAPEKADFGAVVLHRFLDHHQPLRERELLVLRKMHFKDPTALNTRDLDVLGKLIEALVDQFDAIRSKRRYKDENPPDKAARILMDMSRARVAHLGAGGMANATPEVLWLIGLVEHVHSTLLAATPEQQR